MGLNKSLKKVMRLRNISPETLKFRSKVIYKYLRNFTYAFRKKIVFPNFMTKKRYFLPCFRVNNEKKRFKNSPYHVMSIKRKKDPPIFSYGS